MHHSIRRFHIISTVGGGFTGLAVSLAALVGSWSQLKPLAILLVLGACVLCTWVIFVGLRLSEGANMDRELRFFYILQIPHLTTPVLSFHAGFGLMLYIGVLPNGQNISAQLGADWNAGVLTDQNWFWALNILPMLALWLVRRGASDVSASATASVGQ
jgi:hypothetical protein